MFSSDKNIETIGQLVEVIRHYLSLQSKCVKLDIMTKLVRLLTMATMVFVLSVLLMLALIYLSFGAAFALGTLIGNSLAFCVVAGVYILFFFLCICFRKKWIDRPLVRFFADILIHD